MSKHAFIFLAWMAFTISCAKPPIASVDTLRMEVFATERAFAQTMAKRDFQDFASYLSEEAVFFSGPAPLHGKSAVADWWKQYYAPTQAPFSWEPIQVEVLQNGKLALSTGTVRDTEGKVIGEFTSIWRKEEKDKWRIIFDKGNKVCEQVKR